MDGICGLFFALGNSLDLDETLFQFDRDLRRIVAYDAIVVHVPDGDRPQLVYAGGLRNCRIAGLDESRAEQLAACVAASRRPILNLTAAGEPIAVPVLVVPLEHSGVLTAVLGLYRVEAGTFSQTDLTTLLTIAPKLAATIANAREHQTLTRLAGIDPATGVLNARAMFQRLDSELTRARRQGGRIAVLECGVRGLDNTPADLSRSVMRRVASGLRDSCREYDLVARTGEDFVVILADCSATDLDEKRLRLRRIVEEIGFAAGLPLTLMMGAAFFPEDATDTEGLLAMAGGRIQIAPDVADGAPE